MRALRNLLITVAATGALISGCTGPRYATTSDTSAPPFAIDRSEGAPANPEEAVPTGPITRLQPSKIPGESGLDESSSSLSGGSSGSGGGPGG
jgi:hypothetical protein